MHGTCSQMPTYATQHAHHKVQDGLAMYAIRFLTTVAKSVHHELFRNEDVLKQVPTQLAGMCGVDLACLCNMGASSAPSIRRATLWA